MIRFLQNWTGSIIIDGKEYASYSDIPSDFVLSDKVNIQLQPKVQSVPTVSAVKTESTEPQQTSTTVEMNANQQYKIKVKRYMTKPATPDFDFMTKWNKNNPMPLRTMVGTIERETSGMVYMKLHGDIIAEQTLSCMKCGKPITNPISQFFGMGPECGGHNYVNPFESDEELKSVVEDYRKNYLQKIIWEGWIIKSAIIEQENLLTEM